MTTGAPQPPHATAGLGSVLAGVRVLDFTWIVGGPIATRMLASLGADVIKIESRSRPEHLNRGEQFELLNEGKRSCALDLKSEEGRATALTLAAGSDLVIENFSPGTIDRLGLGFEELCRQRRDIVLVSLSGLGQTGPYRDYVSYGSLLQAFSGWTRLVCPADELADDRLGMVPVWADYLAGCMTATAAMTGLGYSRRTGRGIHLDVTVLESVLALMPGPIGDEQRSAGSLGNGSERGGVHTVLRCAGDDEWVAIVAQTDGALDGLERVIDGQPLETWAAARSAVACERELRDAGVPAAVSESLWSLMAKQELWDDRLFQRVGEHDSIGMPWRALDSPDRGRSAAAPGLGEHTQSIIDNLGDSAHQDGPANER